MLNLFTTKLAMHCITLSAKENGISFLHVKKNMRYFPHNKRFEVSSRSVKVQQIFYRSPL